MSTAERRLSSPPVSVKPQHTDVQVRRPGKNDVAGAGPKQTPSALAHAPNRLLIDLNSQWRVTEDDLQYILQRRTGARRSKASGWRCRSFCRTREALLRCIREYCGLVDEGAVKQVAALPEWHVDKP